MGKSVWLLVAAGILPLGLAHASTAQSGRMGVLVGTGEVRLDGGERHRFVTASLWQPMRWSAAELRLTNVFVGPFFRRAGQPAEGRSELATLWGPAVALPALPNGLQVELSAEGGPALVHVRRRGALIEGSAEEGAASDYEQDRDTYVGAAYGVGAKLLKRDPETGRRAGVRVRYGGYRGAGADAAGLEAGLVVGW